MNPIRKVYDIPTEWFIQQQLPPAWKPSDTQVAAYATTGDLDDKLMFDAIIRKGMSFLDARDGGTNGAKNRMRSTAEIYFIAAQSFSRLEHAHREWEDYFPWIVFRNRFMGQKIDWIEWGVAKYGRHYETIDINALLREYDAERGALMA